MGIEVGLSTVVHHTGATIDYTWDTATGHMVRMRRSDDTVLDIQWDDAVGRVAHIFVSNPTTHPGDEPLRLISYEYDPHGQLVRVINSNDGALKYHYDDQGRMYAWTDRNGVSYYYRFDEHGRVHSQVGTGGMFP
ncbi:RHS repeat protein, partial [Corynebacterium sp. MSK041]|uniref:RHS repeat domain-containing protein n=1 Tax=Corynebacterium sp. MSK041 TaxID=3050194 RepID=UPI00254DB2DC